MIDYCGFYDLHNCMTVNIKDARLLHDLYIGVLWPVEGLPSSVRWLTPLMPMTFAVSAVKGVVSKGNFM